MKYQAIGNKIFVRIDKKKQREKSIRPSGLIIPPAFEYMAYMLQWGEIISVGAEVQNPEIRAGRIAIFHHRVEAEDINLIDKLDNGDEIRVVRVSSSAFNYQFYGVFDEQGNILPVDPFIFVWPEVKAGFEKETIVDPNTRIAMNVQVKKTDTGIFTAEIEKSEDEELFVTCEVVAVPPGDLDLVIGETIMAGTDTKYPIDLFGKMYWILQKEFILVKLEKAQ